jgi:hypothetical protein
LQKNQEDIWPVWMYLFNILYLDARSLVLKFEHKKPDQRRPYVGLNLNLFWISRDPLLFPSQCILIIFNGSWRLVSSSHPKEQLFSCFFVPKVGYVAAAAISDYATSLTLQLPLGEMMEIKFQSRAATLNI